MTKTAETPRRSAPARDRLLASASELFYAEGVHTVGIDRIIEHAGVAKASLYNSFGSKDELVRAYLRERHAAIRDAVETGLTRWQQPREKLLGVFVVQGERMRKAEYHGCPFASATAESPSGGVAMQVAAEYRAWLRALFTELASSAGVANPDQLTEQLQLLYDGAALCMRMDGNRDAAEIARVAASALLDAAQVAPLP